MECGGAHVNTHMYRGNAARYTSPRLCPGIEWMLVLLQCPRLTLNQGPSLDSLWPPACTRAPSHSESGTGETNNSDPLVLHYTGCLQYLWQHRITFIHTHTPVKPCSLSHFNQPPLTFLHVCQCDAKEKVEGAGREGERKAKCLKKKGRMVKSGRLGGYECTILRGVKRKPRVFFRGKGFKMDFFLFPPTTYLHIHSDTQWFVFFSAMGAQHCTTFFGSWNFADVIDNNNAESQVFVFNITCSM